MGRFQQFPIQRLRGVNEDENPDRVEDDELTVSLNCWRKGSTKGTRPGLQRDPDVYMAQLAGGVQGMYDFVTGGGAARRLVVVANGDIRDGADTHASIKGSVTVTAGVGNQWTFATHKDKMYAAGGAAGDTFWSWSGTGNAVVVDDGTAPTKSPILESDGATEVTPLFIFQKWNRLFAAGFRDGSAVSTDVATNQTAVRYSALNDGDVWPQGNGFGGTFAIGGISTYGSEKITGFGEYTDGEGDWLVVLTNRQLVAVNESGDFTAPFYITRRGGIANGCVHQNAFVSLGLDSGDAVYLSDKGIHSLRQSQSRGAAVRSFLSWKIRRTFDTINRSAIENSWGQYWPNEGIVVFWVPTGSNTSPDLGLVLDVKNQSELTADNAEWDFWRISGTTANARSLTAATIARDDSGDDYIYAGTAAGDVCRLNDAISNDLGTAYSVRFRTKDNEYGDSSNEKGLGDIYTVIQPSGTYTPTLKPVFNFGRKVNSGYPLMLPVPGAALGSFVLGQDVLSSENPTGIAKVYGGGIGQTIGFEFSHGGANEPFYVGSITPEIQRFGEEAGEAG